MPKPAPATITLDISQDEMNQLAALNALVPLATRHRLARAAFQTGMRVFGEHPETLPALLVALRQQKSTRNNPNT